MNAPSPIRQIIKREGALAPYDRGRIGTAILRAMASVEAGDRARADRLAEAVERALVAAYGVGATPSVEDIQDLVEETLMGHGEVKTARAYIIYRNQRAQARAARAYTFEITDNIPYKKIYDVLRWNMDHGCDTVERLNALIAEGRFGELVRASDRRFEAELDGCVAHLLAQAGSVRLVIIAGPSSSGKTTTAAKLGERLARAGHALKTLNVDHYFFDLERHPRDAFGDVDYEAPGALDMDLLNAHLERLLAGTPVRVPHYDFKTGRRTLEATPFALAPRELLLLDSLHGLFGPMTDRVPAERKFRIYIETLGQVRGVDGSFMRWADNRLMRRMIRDSLHRNSQPDTTLTHWHYVRRSELRHIIPYIGAADVLVNSALPYELPILKPRVFRWFPQAVARYRDDPRRQDAYIRAHRLCAFLEPLTAVPDDAAVSPDSLLREFIGGGRYG